jgi:CRP-like cAMP-binding protein/RsiW-degrading membrane proteinase PrsW (M82 family)
MVFFVYKRYSLERLSLGKSIDALLYGVISAALLVILNPYLDGILPKGNDFLRAFFHAALIEKFLAFFVIYLITYKNIQEATVSSIMTFGIFYAIGFSALENIFYAYEVQKAEIILRFFSSVPLHVTTCAIMGYFLGLHFLSSSKIEVQKNLYYAIVLPIFFHFLYDICLLQGKEFTFVIGPELVILVSLQEYLIAKSTSYPSGKDLRLKKIEFEDWQVIRRQVEYKRWILKSLGKRNVEVVPFYSFSLTTKRKVLITILTGFALFYFILKWILNVKINLQLSSEEQITLLMIYPLVGSFNLLLAGSINREYFKNSIFSLPVVAETRLWINQEDQELNGTDISLYSCFIKTLETIEIGQKVEIVYNYSEKFSPKIRAKVIWNNHENLLEPIGTLFRIETFSWEFFKFILHYKFFRWSRGIIFNLKIPGFEGLRNHFVKAVSVMEDHTYVAEGTILFQEGDKGKEFYLLKKGIVEIFKTTEMGEHVTLNIIEQGNIFGEMAMITGQPRAASAICSTNCLISTSDGDNLEALVLGNPQFSYKLLQTLATRLSNSEVILMNRIESLENEIQILREQNAILQDFLNHPEWEKQIQSVELPPQHTKKTETNTKPKRTRRSKKTK